MFRAGRIFHLRSLTDETCVNLNEHRFPYVSDLPQHDASAVVTSTTREDASASLYD